MNTTETYITYTGKDLILADWYNEIECTLKNGYKFKIDKEGLYITIMNLDGYKSEFYISNLIRSRKTFIFSSEERVNLMFSIIKGEHQTRKQYDDNNILKTLKNLPKENLQIGRAQFSNNHIPLRGFVYEDGVYKGRYNDEYSPLQFATYIYRNAFKVVNWGLSGISYESLNNIEYLHKC